jgi:serine/threonine protein kinase
LLEAVVSPSADEVISFGVDLDALAEDLPQLEILEEIGRGGMGVVFKARQRGLGREVALKVLPSHLAADPSFSERFSRESRALAGLSHPNIVAVHDAGVVGEHHYILMEYVDGADLRKLVKEERLEPEQAFEITSALCEALQYAHDKGVIHRDIKPENVLIDSSGVVKIGDFGLAKLMEEDGALRLTGTLQAMGTLHYVAPEQIERPQEVDHRVDIYSLGVVFYELLTGELPIGRFDVPSTKVKVDESLDEVVLRTLNKDPDRRYQGARDLQEDIRRASSGRDLLGARSSGGLFSSTRIRLAAGALVLTSVGLICFYIYNSRRSVDSSPQGGPQARPAQIDEVVKESTTEVEEEGVDSVQPGLVDTDAEELVEVGEEAVVVGEEAGAVGEPEAKEAPESDPGVSGLPVPDDEVDREVPESDPIGTGVPVPDDEIDDKE